MNTSQLFRLAFWLILLAILILTGIGLLTQQPDLSQDAIQATQVEQTVQAEVEQRLTQSANVATTTPQPDINSTVEARLTITPTAVPEVSAAESVTSGIWSFLRSIWNLFAFGGIGLQICCCLLIPGGVILLFINDTRPRR